ncbi:hypothetical protein Brsp06_02144 [Brucella sp. NBRC 13694]
MPWSCLAGFPLSDGTTGFPGSVRQLLLCKACFFAGFQNSVFEFHVNNITFQLRKIVASLP